VKHTNKKLTIAEINKRVEKFGYKCLTLESEYKNNKQPLKFVCPKNHIWYGAYADFSQGKRCRQCGIEYVHSLQKHTIEYVRKKVEKFGYKCLSREYNGAHDNSLKLQCPEGHIYTVSWTAFQGGKRCPHCYYFSRFKDYKYTENLKQYRSAVTQITEINYKKYYYLINPLNLKRGKDWHLDHIYSVVDGFSNSVEPEVLSSPVNLRMLSAEDNISKNGSSAITKSQLYNWYNCFQGGIIR